MAGDAALAQLMTLQVCSTGGRIQFERKKGKEKKGKEKKKKEGRQKERKAERKQEIEKERKLRY